MGKLALAAKITHVPSMYLSELDGPRKGTRQAAIDGHLEIGRRCRELGVDTIVVFDTHWLVNANYHVNCAPHFKGMYTSNELPHFISNMAYEFPGNPALGKLLAQGVQRARRGNAGARRHHAEPRVRHAGADALHERRPALQGRLGLGAVHGALPGRQRAAGLGDPPRDRGPLRRHGRDLRQRLAVAPLRAERPGARVRVQDLEPVPRTLDHDVVEHVAARRSGTTSATMLPEYAAKGHGEGFMHDTAMLLGALGWSAYDGKAEVITPYFGASGTGQINAVFPVTPQDGAAIPKPWRRRPRVTRRCRRGSDPQPFDHRNSTPCRTSSSCTRRNLDADTDMTALCRTLADTMLAVQRRGRAAGLPHRRRARARLPGGAPRGGRRQRRLRVLLPEPAHGARAQRGHAARPRRRAGAPRRAAHFAPVLARRPVGLTLQVDEGPEVFDGKLGNLHAHFAARASGAER